MKKIINTPENLVLEMCHGIVSSNPKLELIEKFRVIKKKKINSQKVSLISGGGSGHEPAHAGFIGQGMLDAAVCGDVFASPSQIQVYKAIKETASAQGTLLIIKNYSGDMMNFKNAAHLATEDGLSVDYVKVDDDVAVKDSLYTVGRRGVAGTVFVHKIAGAAAEAGLELAAVKELAEKTASNVKSIGFAISSCTVPAKGTPTFELGATELEYGIGIHGEPGISREEMTSAEVLAKRMVETLLAELAIEDSTQEEVALLINGFGATPLQELYVFNHSVMEYLAQKNVRVVRNYVGNYMTSIDMGGASISILKLDEELKTHLTAFSDAPNFAVWGNEKDVEFTPLAVAEDTRLPIYTVETAANYAKIIDEKISLENIVYLVDKMSEIIIENEVPFCELDSHAGDGDFGMSVAKGFKLLKAQWHEIVENDELTIGSFLEECSLIIMEHCGGASGPIWGSAFRGAGKYAKDALTLTKRQFAKMLRAVAIAIQDTGARTFGRGAVVGDKTLIDALIPCIITWEENADNDIAIPEVFKMAADSAVAGAKKTEEIVARMGRAGTVGERSLGYPDAGAHALGIIFTALAEAIS